MKIIQRRASNPERRAHMEEIREGLAPLLKRFPDSYWRDHDERHVFPHEFVAAMTESGWANVTIPEEYGGGGQGIAVAAVVMEAVGASGAAMNGCTAIHGNIFGFEPIIRYGSPELKEKYLRQAAAGSLQMAFGVTEPDAGTDTTRISTRAVKVDGGYEVRGQKVWMSKATDSQKVLLLARTTPREECEKPSLGMSLFVADLDSPNVTRSAIPKAGRNAVASCEVTFDGLFVDEADLVGVEGHGFYHLLTGLNAERVLLAAGALGIGFRALERARTYALERVVFERPIGMNQGVAFPLADSYARLAAAAAITDLAADLYDAGEDCGVEAAMAKYLAADAGYQSADRAVQTHGGFGYAKEYDVERYWREARVHRLAPLSQEFALNHMATRALGLPRSF
ncbi:acyl-CoA/acyl-ACP dehydrogenase [Dactylosporangium roseum]|uniref:Acyl-CoA/acyl-ACP dehydrogenase n=1 Tax=Dactylosporangium roseum TaxID=47989 RepID=A0ABY5YXJ7_9ACTN|nr:acyl-CoA dehydrogenase family protein [Dactylosporangium roseum]UWZ34480.1 acyl-CoA/acyl-ACP dehydrogenase [Dactylosporangium roseum]